MPPHVVPTRTCSVKDWVCLLIGPVVTLKPTIWSCAGSEIAVTGTVPVFWSGQPVFDGGGAAAVTTAVGTVVAESLPSAFFAVTTARRVLPWSADVSVYELAVAPEMSEQLPPPWSQRRHWYEKVNGVVPFQVPFEVVRALPTAVVPEIVGGWVLLGAADAL